ncbi:MAG: hypothetical protein MI919_21715, partial [Holophagales bacterium]|nr:hypothetical protein [Holophagales bacterium]
PDGGPPPEHWAVIRSDGEHFQLSCRENGRDEPLQRLRFNPKTCTLESLPRDRPRCLSLWFGERRRVFGMRLKKNPLQPMPVPYPSDLFPWESSDDDGTWGAEEEPPPA